MASWRLTAALVAAGLTSASAAWAQTEDAADAADSPAGSTEGSEGAAEGAPAASEGGEAAAGEEPFTEEQLNEIAEAKAGNSPVELPGKTYYFVGARYRAIIVPKFMLNLFADGGATELVHGFGPEFGIREDGFEYSIGAWFGLYGTGQIPFKGKDDPYPAWEIIQSKLKIFYLTSDFLWTQDITPEFGINYGFGAGVGIVFGDLLRSQAYPANPGDPPKDWVKCQAVGVPDPTFCDNDNDHYGNYKEPSWVNGGSKPNVFPWLALQTGLRYKPAKQFVGRLDLGFGTSGFFIGIGADYGI